VEDVEEHDSVFLKIYVHTDGFSALDIAVHNNNVAITRLLLQHGFGRVQPLPANGVCADIVRKHWRDEAAYEQAAIQDRYYDDDQKNSTGGVR